MRSLPDTRVVADAQKFDTAKLNTYLTPRIDDFQGLADVRQFNGGASNPTFLLVERGEDGRLFVLRKKPPGRLLASAHQVDREFRAMTALRKTDVPVPNMRILCADDAIIGTSFYVMDFLEGRIFRDARLPEQTPEERTAIYDELNATLAKLHSINFEKIGLADFGRPGNYFERQIARWTKQYRNTESEKIDAMEKLIKYLPQHIPQDHSVSIAHGDYRLENVMFHPTEPKLIAILDWELSTIGHPIADIAYNCLLWHSVSEVWGTLSDVDFTTSGIPTEKHYRDKYCRRMGRAVIPNWNFYLAFSLFRLASISQGVFKRVRDGVASTDRPAINDTPARAAQAWRFITSGA